jgi:hypothetical protein
MGTRTGDIVLEFRPEEMAHYREIIASVDVPSERKDVMIKTLASLMQTFIDAAFGVDAVQLAQQARLRDSFQKSASHATVPHGHVAERVDLRSDGEREGANTQNNNEHKGCAPWNRHI